MSNKKGPSSNDPQSKIPIAASITFDQWIVNQLQQPASAWVGRPCVEMQLLIAELRECYRRQKGAND